MKLRYDNEHRVIETCGDINGGWLVATLCHAKDSLTDHTLGHQMAAAPLMKACLEDILDFLKRSGYDTRMVREVLAQAKGEG